MKKKKIPRYIYQEVICPCCRELKTASSLTNIIGRKFFFLTAETSVNFEMLQTGSSGWACDDCIKAGKALLANPRKQQYCDQTPYLFYIDYEKECTTCHEKFIFKKEEQLYWYEELKFWVQSVPVNCLSCRKKVRHQKELSRLLEKETIKGYEELIKISDIYREIGNIPKATEYSRKAKKLIQSKNI